MAVIAPHALAKRAAMYRAILDALADDRTLDRPGLYRVLATVHASTANRVIREMLASGHLVARRSAPGASKPMRYAATISALDVLTPARPTGVRVRLHDGGRYRIMTRPCAQHTQGRVLMNMTWREALGDFTAPREDQTRWPLELVESVYSSVAAGFVPIAQCDRVPLATLPYTLPSTIAGVVVELLATHGPLTVSAIAERLPQFRKTIIKTQMMRMATEQTVMRVGGASQAGRIVTTWTVGPVPLNGRQSRGRPALVDTYTPAPWIHPIRRRALGLPSAQAPRNVPETDFGNPLRSVA
jgi:hypothetical protein